MYVYTHGWSQLGEDRLAVLESFIGLEVELDALAAVVADVEKVLEREIALRGWWMRHYRDDVGVIVKFAHHDVGLQHHDVLFKKESRLLRVRVSVRARECEAAAVVETTGWAGGFVHTRMANIDHV